METQLLLFETPTPESKLKQGQPRTPDGEWVSAKIATKYDKKMNSLRETIRYFASLNAFVIRENESLKQQIKQLKN
ncbi:MAG: hypothetical protein WCH34_18270 [Bacteroidota bacterium]